MCNKILYNAPTNNYIHILYTDVANNVDKTHANKNLHTFVKAYVNQLKKFRIVQKLNHLTIGKHNDLCWA